MLATYFDLGPNFAQDTLGVVWYMATQVSGLREVIWVCVVLFVIRVSYKIFREKKEEKKMENWQEERMNFILEKRKKVREQELGRKLTEEELKEMMMDIAKEEYYEV